ncbi:MAG: hypothetical protein ACI9VR_004073 [Cognaticolwellia sp.]|jgi:hypothetical protein
MFLLLLACSGSDPALTPPTPSATLTATPEPVEIGIQVEPGLLLRSIVATSGNGAGLLGSGWKPPGDAVAEGVLLRFESPQLVDTLSIASCGTAVGVEIYANGNGGSELEVGPQGGEVIIGQQVSSLFVKVKSADRPVCLKGLKASANGEDLRLGPPRNVAGKISASSTLDPADAYHASYLVDGRTDFGWVEGAADLGLGESVSIDLDRVTRIQAIELWNGYQRSPDHFAKNGRVKVLGLSVDGGPVMEIPVQDSSGAQTLTLPSLVEARQLTLSIVEATAGSRYPDVVISELRLIDPAGPLGISVSGTARSQALLSVVKSGPLSGAVDARWVNVCGPENARELKLRSNHSFVYYADDFGWNEPDAQNSMVFDGAWVPNSGGKATLYGRKHMVSSSWQPYGDDSVTERTRIAGGKIQWIPVASLSEAEFKTELEDLKARGGWYPADCLGADSYEELKGKGAAIVQGEAVLDLLVPGS